MRDLVVREALHDLAEEASERFRELVRAGEEVPYEVREPGRGSPLATYAPLTGRFIRDRTALIARLASFGPAKSALATAGLPTPYLESLGVVLAPSEGRRAEDAIVTFLCRVWEDRSDFTFEPSRVDAMIAELEACAESGEDEVEVVVPLVGLRMTATRLELATTTVVRSDTVEAPPEVNDSEGAGRAGWEPHFLAVSRCRAEDLEPRGEDDAGPAAPLAERFHAAVTAMRLFKPGGVGLGPHAWVRPAGRRWRRISTGAGRARPGAYRLADSELGSLAGLSRALERRPLGRGPLARAISRFEAGLARDVPLDALNDHLLALRFLLEGDGPAQTGMPLRVAALCAPPAERDAVRAVVERALALERELWSGDPAPGGEGISPAEVASEVEDLTRAILRDAACGHLGDDLRAAADEILLADGLAAGEGAASQRGETSEWDAGIELEPETIEEELPGEQAASAQPSHPEDVAVDDEPARPPHRIALERVDEPIEAELAEREGSAQGAAATQPELASSESEAPRRPRDGWIPFVIPDEADSKSPAPREHDPDPAQALEDEQPGRNPERTVERQRPQPRKESRPRREREPLMEASRQDEDWLADIRSGETLDFPSRGPAMRLLDQRPEERKAMRERVSSLFPAPETTDWSVGELDYEQNRRARA